ncbi:MAG: helix-turn-helix transcriptional regulator [Defluviitaleaceae bacterium]|nr:helix-turn-helix transcriptional regulator [Defluviitaleaceae bacterium]
MNTLTLGEKLKEIRTAQGLSQDQVARAVKKYKSDISRFESGQAEPNQDVLEAIRKFLNISNAPLLPPELELYKDRLAIWEELLDANRNDEARTMQPEMASILTLPYEYDLIFQYMMQESRLLFKERNLSSMAASMEAAEALLDNVSIKALYLYHNNKGLLYDINGKYKSALNHYLTAVDLLGSDRPDYRILMNIARVYCQLGKLHCAIRYAECGKREFRGDRTNKDGVNLNFLLADLYSHVYEFDKSEKMFNIVIQHARSIDDKFALGAALACLGNINRLRKNYSEALGRLNQGLEIIEKLVITSDNWRRDAYSLTYALLTMIFAKVSCIMRMNKSDKNKKECQEVIALGRSYAQGNETLTIIINAISHLTTLDNPESTRYIEDVAIPYIINHLHSEASEKTLVLAFCRELVEHYEKKKAKTKLAKIKAIMCDIYEDMFLGG